MTSRFCYGRRCIFIEKGINPPLFLFNALCWTFKLYWYFISKVQGQMNFYIGDISNKDLPWAEQVSVIKKIPPLIESSYMPASSFEPASTSNQVSSLISLALLFYLVIKPYLEIKRYLKMNHYLEMKCYLEIKQYLLAMFFWWRPSWKDQWLTMMKIDPENTRCKIGTVANWPVNPFQKSCDPIKFVIWPNKWKKSQFFCEHLPFCPIVSVMEQC